MEKDNEPAFPIRERQEHIDGAIVCNEWPGLTKREWFAGMAMQAFIRNQVSGKKWEETAWKESEVAEVSLAMADAMIEASKK